MEIELNRLISQFARVPFRVQGVYRYAIEPGTTGWQKSAPFPGFIFPLSGQGQYIFDGTPYVVGAGTVLHGGANMSLDKSVIGDADWEFISVLYDVNDAKVGDISLPDTHFELTIGQSPRLAELLHRLWNTASRPGALPEFQMENLFRSALEEVFICADHNASGHTHSLFQQVSAYIHEHYMDALTVRALAEQNGVNENRLYYVFYKHAGMGPGDYLTAYRLSRAKELLITGSAPVGKVAKSVGYPDALYFSRAFSRRFGMSPSTFREQFRNNP